MEWTKTKALSQVGAPQLGLRPQNAGEDAEARGQKENQPGLGHLLWNLARSLKPQDRDSVEDPVGEHKDETRRAGTVVAFT